MLFVGIILFIILLFVLKIVSGDHLSYNPGDDKEFYKLRFDKELLASLSTAMVAYGFQPGFFPIYNSLQKQTFNNGMKFSILGMSF